MRGENKKSPRYAYVYILETNRIRGATQIDLKALFSYTNIYAALVTVAEAVGSYLNQIGLKSENRFGTALKSPFGNSTHIAFTPPATL